MENEKKDWQASLKLAQEALTKIDKEKYPKRYKIQEELVDTLQYNENMRIRAEKAEEKAKETITPKKETEKETPIKPVEDATPKSGLSSEDVLTLVNAKITHPDDIKEVKDYASYKGISVDEALKSSVVKTTLQTNVEERATSEATNTKGGKRVTSKTSGKELLRRVGKGELLETDEDYTKLAEARLKSQQES